LPEFEAELFFEGCAVRHDDGGGAVQAHGVGLAD
jgi:hypothetical protein